MNHSSAPHNNDDSTAWVNDACHDLRGRVNAATAGAEQGEAWGWEALGRIADAIGEVIDRWLTDGGQQAGEQADE
jgi:hypothetical protein